jgi:hypothetical protein
MEMPGHRDDLGHDGAGQEGPLLFHCGDGGGKIADCLLGGFPVGREVALPAEPVVIDPAWCATVVPNGAG